jgi:hypothetical protein
MVVFVLRVSISAVAIGCKAVQTSKAGAAAGCAAAEASSEAPDDGEGYQGSDNNSDNNRPFAIRFGHTFAPA